MSTSKKLNTESESVDLQLEQRKVKALEKIANSLDALTVWFEEIEKQEWSDRMQYYLYEFHKNSTEVKDAVQHIASRNDVAIGGEISKRPKKDSEKV